MTLPFLYIDFETRGLLDLREVGLHRYARHPDTDVWCMSWALNDAEPRRWTGLNGSPNDALTPMGFVLNGGTVVAHNAAFELAVWNEILVPRYGWPVLRPEQVVCTLALSYAMGLPGALEDAALALGLHVLKDTEGRSLTLRMARPRKVLPDGQIIWWDEPEKLARLYAYCQQDVRVEREIHKRVMPLSAAERRVWLMDYKINQRGVRFDMPSVDASLKMVGKIQKEYDDAINEATGGEAENVNALFGIKSWLKKQGIASADHLAKQDVVDLLAGDLPEGVQKVLTLRQEASKASTAKLQVIRDQADSAGRLHNLFAYHAANTGRWAGRAVQPHNFPRDVPPTSQVEAALRLIREEKYNVIDMAYGPPLTVLSKCLRGFILPEPGKVLVGGDFANIEGRGTAWVSGEQWKLDAFIAADAKTGPGIYELAYSRMYGVSPDSIKNPSHERQIGKVSELALGYQGGVGAFQTMAKTYGVKVSDVQANEFKILWRAAHPRIKATWGELQAAAIKAVTNKGETFSAGYPGRGVKFKVAGSFLWCLLPSNRALCYPYPKILEGEYGPQLTYMTMPSPDDKKKGKIIDDPHNSPKWARVGTYGGSLMENIVQAFCRDMLVHGMLKMEEAGYPVVLHVHDEIVCEVNEVDGANAAQLLTDVMKNPPTWAKDFPLYGKGSVMQRYGK